MNDPYTSSINENDNTHKHTHSFFIDSDLSNLYSSSHKLTHRNPIIVDEKDNDQIQRHTSNEYSTLSEPSFSSQPQPSIFSFGTLQSLIHMYFPISYWSKSDWCLTTRNHQLVIQMKNSWKQLLLFSHYITDSLRVAIIIHSWSHSLFLVIYFYSMKYSIIPTLQIRSIQFKMNSSSSFWPNSF